MDDLFAKQAARSFFRDALLEAGAIDLESRTARFTFSSELPTLRENHPEYGTFWEILSHGPGDANIGFLNTEGVALFNHDPVFEIGKVVPGTVKIGADRKGRATIKFDEGWACILKAIESGEARNQVSIGYDLLTVLSKKFETNDGYPTIRFSWKPGEISLLTSNKVAADPTVGIGSARRYHHRSKSMKNFNQILEAAAQAVRSHDPYDGYSLSEAFDFDKEPEGVTREACAEVKAIGGEPLTHGRFVPFSAIAPRWQRDRVARDLTVASAGALVIPDIQPIVSILKNRTAAVQLGAISVTGLEGDFALPQETAATTASTLDETAVAGLSDVELSQQIYGPKRISIAINVSKQLLLTTGGGQARLEAFLRYEMGTQISTIVDRLIFNGRGNQNFDVPEPLGLLAMPGLGSVIYGGVSWPGIVAAEKSLTDMNADIGTLGFAISSSTRNKWKQVSRLAGYPSFIMEDGMVNGYPAVPTNNLGQTNQSVFGNWSDLFLLFWGDGVYLTKNPYDLDQNAKIRYVMHCWFNFVPRHFQSFCISADRADV